MVHVNLIYTCAQLVHNFGAVAVVGSPAVGWWIGRENIENRMAQHRLAWLMLFGWVAQGASGAGFGATSYFLKGQLPDIAGVALVALTVKIGCVLAGVGFALLYLKAGLRWSIGYQQRFWQAMVVLAAMALSAAAFLRWFL
jgi:hypothetical protein